MLKEGQSQKMITVAAPPFLLLTVYKTLKSKKMLLYNIYNYDDFKTLFGIEIHGNGAKSRKNKILLAHLKNRQLIKYCREHDDYSLLRIRSMPELKKTVLEKIQESGRKDGSLLQEVKLINMTLFSRQFRTDDLNGICEDLDASSVRYINVERNHPFKMRAGKFFIRILKECELGKVLSEQVITWLGETFASDWESFTKFHHPEIQLHVDSHFGKIYSSTYCKDFRGNSCMQDKERHYFYRDSVDAKAAYLTDREGMILARAILFTDVTDQFGNKHKLLERQYSKESSIALQRLLVDYCIREGHITGYKAVGAGCHDSRNFVANDGSSLADLEFSIRCDLGWEDTLSYQDSFKFLDYKNKRAYNFKFSDYYEALDTTDLNLNGDDDEDDSPYCEYYHHSCDEVTLAFLHGEEIFVDSELIGEDFRYVEDLVEWHHKDDITYCDHCGKMTLREESVFEKEDDSIFCCEEHHKAYIEEKWHFAQYEEKYYPNVTDITTVSQWDSLTQSYHRLTISVESLDSLKREGKAFGFGESWFIMIPELNAEAA